MKIRSSSLVAILLLTFTACERNFDELMDEAREASQEQNHTVVIDSLTLALPRWKEEHGAPQKAEAYELLGKSYYALKKPDQAADSFRVAIKLSDNTYDSAYLLGLICTASFQHKSAQEAFQNALRMKKDAPLALLGLGDSLFAQGKYNDAKEIYKRVLAVSPGVPEALKNIDLVDNRTAVKKSTPLLRSRTRPKSMKLIRKKH